MVSRAFCMLCTLGWVLESYQEFYLSHACHQPCVRTLRGWAESEAWQPPWQWVLTSSRRQRQLVKRWLSLDWNGNSCHELNSFIHSCLGEGPSENSLWTGQFVGSYLHFVSIHSSVISRLLIQGIDRNRFSLQKVKQLSTTVMSWKWGWNDRTSCNPLAPELPSGFVCLSFNSSNISEVIVECESCSGLPFLDLSERNP